MEQPTSFYDWEQNLKKRSNKKKSEPKVVRILNSIDIPHDIFTNYLEKWKSENMKKDD